MDPQKPHNRPAITSPRTKPLILATVGMLTALTSLSLAQEVRRPRVVDPNPDSGPSEVRPVRELSPEELEALMNAEQEDAQPEAQPEPEAEVEAPEQEQPEVPMLEADPAKDLLDFANLHYNAQDFELALARYNEYLAANPKADGARTALYNSAECLRKLKLANEAEARYLKLVEQFKTGPLVGESAYKSGALAYNRRDYANALPRFRVAEQELARRDDNPALLLDTRFRMARCLQNSDRAGEATPLLETVVKSPDPNPFRDKAMLSLGRNALEANQKDKALKYFQTLVAKSETPAIRAEAATRAALLMTDAGDKEKADAMFELALKIDGADEWKAIAQFGLIKARYTDENWQGVVDAYQLGVFKLSDDIRAQMFLMVGNSYHKLDNTEQAIKVYSIIENFFKDRDEGKEATYRKLLIYYQTKHAQLDTLVDDFVLRLRASDIESPLIDRALLLKAERAFAEKRYRSAVNAYDEIRPRKLSEDYRNTFHYRHGWALSYRSQLQAAAAAFTQFITRAEKDDPRFPTALAKRGACYKKAGENKRALADFTRVFTNYPDSAEAEYAYQNAGLLHEVAGNTRAMIATFSKMLEAFPESKGAAEANYWIGRGHYSQKEYEKAVAPLIKARDMDPDRYGEPAGSRIVLSYFALKDVDNLQRETKRYIGERSSVPLPQQVLAWLGIKLYDRGEFTDAEHVLRVTSTPDAPAESRPLVWKYLGKSRLETGNFDGAVQAIDYYLESTDKPLAKANALRDKAIAYYHLEQHDEAMKHAEAAQSLIKQGRINAELWLLRGDIERARGNLEKALSYYTIPSQTFDDPEITPLALFRTAQMLEQLGKREDALKFTRELREKYPDWKRPAK
ncbi:tetratricopeptide repeat protein [Sulfuriroseicoccus oceanibius]|uniref:Tetratricopeptide repeat protein n=1 Tax=Sulfuriroseicoccus oceanibius TaxID=2707525 RepID=A0A6B3L1G7_9BACT|nr:tetratricopeptide repeat protein [Sulfuriroseicoccus oceanibius]QQL46146.1 tetratricopeptide repeat protein [Sulfuriroseicoccus oceanibius]